MLSVLNIITMRCKFLRYYFFQLKDYLIIRCLLKNVLKYAVSFSSLMGRDLGMGHCVSIHL